MGELRKKFCQKCYFPLSRTSRIKNKMKIVKCEECGEVYRWKIKE